MICISIAQESRRLALADMLNASRQCDLLEIRLDRFEKAPDVAELLAHKSKPIIFSCRREQDGGAWGGSEEERLALLRQCIVDKADYVEIELDVADQIRPFPPTKRVISYSNWRETPTNIAEIYAEAQTKKPDVVKLMTLARSPEEAWPLLQILAKPALPTVVVGLGKPGVMLSVFGKKIGAPWTYAALEKGMEAYPGQPTVNDLRQIYHYDDIGRSTRLVAVTGFTLRDQVTAAALNAGLAHLGRGTRCLPVGVGSIGLFRKVMDAVKMAGVVVGEEHREVMTGIATELEPEAREAHATDLLVPKDKSWQGYNTLAQAALAALEGTLSRGTGAGEMLVGRMVMIVGVNATARALASSVKNRQGIVIIASHQREKALNLAQAIQSRHVQFEALYTTMHEILIVCDEEKEHSRSKSPGGETGIHAGYLRAGMTVMDLTAATHRSALLREAELRGCQIVSPRAILRAQLAAQLHLLTGKEAPAEVLEQPLLDMLEEEA
ncbi:MAG TPA: type I 3-dehydroquinate dehydratase [Gemmataceae bacterium]|nr:type I 3-dehydroquinate dehydratase [Gemmataceae bacterium]